MADSQDGLPLHKRPRVTSEDSDPSSIPLLRLVEDAKHDEEFYFADGNIILVTTSRPTAFRVYKALLARQAEAFADMFASSTALERESYEGCPVVELADAPEDLRHLFRVLIPTTDPLFRPKKDHPLPTLHQLSAIIRLSHKYRIERLQEQALSALREDYCDTLDAYDARVPVYARGRYETHMIEVIELARLTNTPSLLPVAFYDTLELLSEWLMNGWVREDGTVVHLSKEDFQRCMDCRISFYSASLDRALRMTRLAAAITCELGPRCRQALLHLCGGLNCSSGDYLYIEDPLAGPKSSCSWSWLVENYDGYEDDDTTPCETCIEKVRAKEKEDREKMWGSLPWFFDITVPGWPKSKEATSAP